jgi:hypothetical protein
MQGFLIVTGLTITLLAWPIAMFTGTMSYLIVICAPLGLVAVLLDDLNSHRSS